MASVVVSIVIFLFAFALAFFVAHHIYKVKITAKMLLLAEHTKNSSHAFPITFVRPGWSGNSHQRRAMRRAYERVYGN